MTVHLPEWPKTLERAFQGQGKQLFLVGGAVRDLELKRSFEEWDFATNSTPEETEEILRSCQAKQIGLIGKRFGTVTANYQGERVEITTFRGESYEDNSRKPTVTWGTSIKDDLSRRDFTINAMAVNVTTDEFLDPFEGLTDLKNKIIRSVGDANDRFSEDPLRMLRAIRSSTQLGFDIEPSTLSSIGTQKERFAILSAERVAAELNKILLTPKPSHGIRLIVETGLVAYILPELIPTIDLEFDPKEHKDIYEHILQVLDNTPAELGLRWCALLHDIAKPLTRRKDGFEYSFHGHENLGARATRTVLSRLKYDNDFISLVTKLVRLHQRLPNNDGHWTDGAVRRFVRDAGETLDDLFTFAAADSTGANQTKLAKYQSMRDEMQERIRSLEAQAEIAKIKSPLDGYELMALYNRPAGVWLKEVKQYLLDLVLDGTLEPKDKEGAKKLAQKFLLKE